MANYAVVVISVNKYKNIVIVYFSNIPHVYWTVKIPE